MSPTLVKINTKQPVSFYVEESAEDFYGKTFWNNVQAGLYEQNQISDIVLTLSRAKKIPNFIDIGSSCGLYSLIAGSLGLEVLSVEPDINQFKALTANLKLNPQFKIKGVRAIIIGDNDFKLSSYALDLNNNNLTKVLKISIDSLLEGFTNILIKCDIEGGEWAILRSKKFKQKVKSCEHLDIFLSIHIGFFSHNYNKNYLCKTIYRINYLRELFTLLGFAMSADKIFYGGLEIKPWALLRLDRIFGGGGFTEHLHLVFRNDLRVS